MSNNTQKEISKLVNLNKDACEFYEEAKEKVDSVSIKQTFSNLETLHRNVMTNLQQQLRIMGGDPEADETFGGDMAQLWANISASVSNDTDTTWVSHLEEAEDRCLHQIQDIMKDEDIDASVKASLTKEAETLRQSHDFMKDLKDCMKKAA